MKNRLTTCAVFLAIMALPIAAYAQGKIGIININAAIAIPLKERKRMRICKRNMRPGSRNWSDCKRKSKPTKIK